MLKQWQQESDCPVEDGNLNMPKVIPGFIAGEGASLNIFKTSAKHQFGLMNFNTKLQELKGGRGEDGKWWLCPPSGLV